MTHSVDLNTTIPPELVDEFLKKLPYVSESLVEYELVTAPTSQVHFNLRQSCNGQGELVRTRILEVADKLCRSYRPGSTKVLVARNSAPSTYRSDPHPV